ncbi:Bacterial SH3 domain protein [compost metagenome]
MLRMSPSMNSEIIEKLDKNTIVAVIGKKDRQWIYVQVKSGNDILLGWVNRTYTKPLKR